MPLAVQMERQVLARDVGSAAPRMDAGCSAATCEASKARKIIQPHDPLDSALETAHRTWPELDLSAGTVSSRLIRIGRLLERRYEEVLAPFNLRLNDLDILGALSRAGGVIPLSAIGRSLMLSSTTMTTRVDRLEERGYVERSQSVPPKRLRGSPDNIDRRVVPVRLTPEGQDVLDRILPLYVAAVRESTECLANDERRLLEDVLRALLAWLDPAIGRTE